MAVDRVLSNVLYGLYSNNYEKDIAYIYQRIAIVSNIPSSSEKQRLKELRDKAGIMLKSVKIALLNEAFRDFKDMDPMDRFKIKKMNDKFYSYPNSYSAYEDLLFYKGRLLVLRNRIISITDPLMNLDQLTAEY